MINAKSWTRYGVAVFLKPVYDEEDLKERKLPKNTYTLQTLQNSIIRVIYGLKIQNCVNMKNVREKIKMMSVNQMAVYHTLLEAYNVMSHLSSEQIKMKWTIIEKKYALRSSTNKDLKVPEKPKKVEMYGFYIQWSKFVQHVTTSNEGNQRHKYLQNYDEKLDMGKHPFILVISI